MSLKKEKHGSCLCGAVTLAVTVENASVGACHCGMCRKWAGGPSLMVETKQPVRITAGVPKVYNSSDWAERAFCEQCGTHLYYRLKAGGFESVPVGVLDGDDDWTFDLQVYVDSKPKYYCFANQTKEMTGAEVEAMFTGQP
ncbi:GFA family protein [Pseudomonas fontis]|uniref:GFA family protein n=1 Tax=Pseudomonas fontis TaxID=2942633 RepID=A0ABT5NQK1_9PSED|nr:GFA family protein [Pseudomonas fontis]MDD0974612.1 GFA family protein [Pseudomonas fontis]MDD0990445.1 GFA family protein [Pseudomonas fontis]